MARERVLGCGAATQAKIDSFFAANPVAHATALSASPSADGGGTSASAAKAAAGGGAAKRRKTSGRPPVAGRGAGACVMGEVAHLPFGMAAPPLVEYCLTGPVDSGVPPA